jgi:hypothetical protein
MLPDCVICANALMASSEMQSAAIRTASNLGLDRFIAAPFSDLSLIEPDLNWFFRPCADPPPIGCHLTKSNPSKTYVVSQRLPAGDGFKAPSFAVCFSNFPGGAISRTLANFWETRNARNDKRREFLRGV